MAKPSVKFSENLNVFADQMAAVRKKPLNKKSCPLYDSQVRNFKGEDGNVKDSSKHHDPNSSAELSLKYKVCNPLLK